MTNVSNTGGTPPLQNDQPKEPVLQRVSNILTKALNSGDF